MIRYALPALLLALAGCNEPTDGAEASQTVEQAELAPTLSPEQEQTDDTPRETPDEDLDAEVTN